MNKKEIMEQIVSIHNTMAEISVKGEDAIRMADVLNKCRTLVNTIFNDLKQSQLNSDKADDNGI